MATYSTSDLSRRSGDVIADALREPVTIMQRNKPRLVLLNIEDFRKLLARADARTAAAIEDMPDALFDEFRNALAAYEDADETA